MSTSKRVPGSSTDTARTGRIVPLNMQSETNGLNYDSLIQDMEKTNDHAHQHFDCSFWA